LLEGAAASSALERQQAFVAHELALERVFFDAGGTLMVGTDPTGGGQALPGHAGLRSLWLLAKAGFRVEDVVKIATLNAARYLGREAEIGSIAPGKRADLVLFRRGLEGGDGFTMERVAWVMKAGVAYDSTKLLEPWRG
jgi:enamidase